MQKSVTKYFAAAESSIVSGGFINREGKIPSAYKGAVSAFGASLIMSGLIPTLQFYMNSSENRDADSGKIINAIASILKYPNAEALKADVMQTTGRGNLNEKKKKIVDAAIALKIMLRTYEFDESIDANDGY